MGVLSRISTNKKFRHAVSIAKYAIPAYVIGSELYHDFRDFIEYKKNGNTVADDRYTKICGILGVDRGAFLVGTSAPLGTMIFLWMFKQREFKRFKLLKVLKLSDGEKIDDLSEAGEKELVLLFEYKNEPLLLTTSFIGSTINGCEFTSTVSREQLTKFIRDIYKEFLDFADIKNNVIEYKESLTLRKKQNVSEKITQIDVKKLCKEYNITLKRGKKRAAIIAGVPGTGKSTIIRKMEKEVTEYPFIYLHPSRFRSMSGIDATFKMIRDLQPCYGILEDMDSCEFDRKNPLLGYFLDAIDGVHGRLNCILIATINDSSLIHYSLINRPGRFDEVLQVLPPGTLDEVYGVLINRNNKVCKELGIKDLFMSKDDIDPELVSKILTHKLTQADICEIVEKGYLLSDRVNNEVLLESLDNLLKSKQVIKSFNFSNKDPLEYGSPEEISSEQVSSFEGDNYSDVMNDPSSKISPIIKR